jgi:hypothetical protein
VSVTQILNSNNSALIGLPVAACHLMASSR